MVELMASLVLCQIAGVGSAPVPRFTVVSLQRVELAAPIKLASGSSQRSLTLVALDASSVDAMAAQDVRKPTMIVDQQVCMPIWNWDVKRMWCLVGAIAQVDKAVVWGPRALIQGHLPPESELRTMMAKDVAAGSALPLKGVNVLPELKLKDWNQLMTMLLGEPAEPR